MTAKQIIAQIDRNVSALYAREIDHEEFGVRQREAWAPTDDRPRLHAAVLKILRARMYGDTRQ